MAMNLVRELSNKFSTAAWIRDPVRNLTLRKSRGLRLIMGYPNELANDSLVDAFYDAFPEVGASFFTPYLESHRLLTSRIFMEDATENFTTGVANAYYRPGRNTMTILAGVVQPPLFIEEGPPAYNYGGLGQVVGHEIMHGYDVNGITLDETVNRVDYEDTQTMREYAQKVLCLRASYQRVESTARALTHDTYDSEGFADFTGMLLTYSAFKRLPAAERNRVPPDLGLNAEMTFFVSHCLKWCGTSKTNQRRRPGGRYWHTRSRCLVPLMNMPEFSAAFSCKAGSFMNPAKKCTFW
ncbi:neprilysin-1-like [Amblyomma americanum]